MNGRQRVLGLCAAVPSTGLVAGCGGADTTPATSTAVQAVPTGDLPRAHRNSVGILPAEAVFSVAGALPAMAEA